MPNDQQSDIGFGRAETRDTVASFADVEVNVKQNTRSRGRTVHRSKPRLS